VNGEQRTEKDLKLKGGSPAESLLNPLNPGPVVKYYFCLDGIVPSFNQLLQE
jgi:hypothetical protein